MKLFSSCEVMGINNTNVAQGVANGTTAIFNKVVLFEGKQAHKICYNGYWVYAVNVEDVNYVQLEWTKDSTFQGKFTLAPKETTCITKFNVCEFGRTEKMDVRVKICQFQMTVNHATTGHKL